MPAGLSVATCDGLFGQAVDSITLTKLPSVQQHGAIGKVSKKKKKKINDLSHSVQLESIFQAQFCHIHKKVLRREGKAKA